MAAFTIGGAIILLELANEQGIIKIDWNRLTRKADQVGDKVQKAVTGEGPKWMEKVNSTKITIFSIFFSLPKLQALLKASKGHTSLGTSKLISTQSLFTSFHKKKTKNLLAKRDIHNKRFLFSTSIFLSHRPIIISEIMCLPLLGFLVAFYWAYPRN